MKQFVIISVCLVFLLNISCGGARGEETANLRTESYQKGQYNLIMSYPNGKAEYGSRIDVKLTIEYPEDEQWQLLPVEAQDGEDLSNTIIHDIFLSPQIILGNGRATADIKIVMEAYLPGKAVLPAMTVRFLQDITTEAVVIAVESAITGDAEQAELSPIWVPDPPPKANLIIIISAATALLLTFFLIITVLRKRRLKAVSALPMPEKTVDELMDDFKISFIETDDVRDIRGAFRQLSKIIDLLLEHGLPAEKHDEFKAVCLDAGFSGKIYSSGDVHRRLCRIWDEIAGGKYNDL
jgi:hypothetical protein